MALDVTVITNGVASPVQAHKASHQSGGSDQISVAGLSGLLATPQTPAAHTQDWTTITGKPTTFAPSAHNTDWSTIVNEPSSTQDYYCEVYYTVDWTVANGVWTMIPANATVVNVGGFVWNSTNGLAVPVTGMYAFQSALLPVARVGGWTMGVKANTYFASVVSVANTVWQMTLTGMAYLAAGQYLQPMVNQADGVDKVFRAAASYSLYFRAARL